MAIRRTPKKSPGAFADFQGRKWGGLELDFDGIVAGPERQRQRKMAKIWRKLIRGRLWPCFAHPGPARTSNATISIKFMFDVLFHYENHCHT
jgi:hypothetical protein